MASSFVFLDELIRDYFNYRGLTTTLRTFDNETSKLTSGPFRADRITEQLTLYIHQSDLTSLIDYWNQLEQRLLSSYVVHSQQQNHFLTRIRTGLYRCYLVHAIQSSRTDKVYEFFERLTKVLQQSNEWTKEWFSLPFIKNPEENSTFQSYFSKQWNDVFWISLQNFLSTAFYHMSPPKICAIEETTPQTYANLISQQTNASKALLPPSARIDPSMAGFAEVLDEIQIANTPSSFAQTQRASYPTIMSKFRNKLPSFTGHSKSISIPASQEPTSGNQILLTNDDSSNVRLPIPSVTPTPTRPKALTIIPDETHFDIDDERLIHLADLRHHSSTIIDCQLNTDGTLFSTLDVQSQVKIWSTNDDFNVMTSLTSRSALLQCQTFDTRQSLLYLGTSTSTVKVLHITEKKIVNEVIIDQNYPRIMSIYPYPWQNRLLVSAASASRLNPNDNSRVRSGRISILDLQTWSIERALMDMDENYVTCMTVHPDRQLVLLGLNDGKIALYDVRSNLFIHQKQQHSRFVQDIRCNGDQLYTIGKDNNLVRCHLSAIDKQGDIYELPYSAVGPFPSTILSSNNDSTTGTASVARPSTAFNNPNVPFYPMGNIFDFDPFDSDRLITCSSNGARFYRLSTSDEDDQIHLSARTNSTTTLLNDLSSASSCVRWHKERDMCVVTNVSGLIQLYRRMNRKDT